MTKIDDWKPEVGMEVFIVSSWNRRPPYVDTITKVGKKYFYIGMYCQQRYSIETKAEDNGGYSSQSYCYRSEADYNRVVELQNKRREIEHNLRKLTDEQIDQVYDWINANTPQ